MTNIIQFPEKEKEMRIYRVTMTEVYVIELAAFNEDEAIDEGAKFVSEHPDDYCVDGTIQVERID